ncbi:hypothetical protein [Phyllobacterium brassicacearum]|uniref:hypothetical protein n=1 Tax=Phyllobacterium brassicacearum TaxID=314235 RepID=UPI001FE1A6EA|nr:hypothetical protein [Phyllobacterium brassicacearum]
MVGFGDFDFAPHTYPSLTTVRIDRRMIGTKAARSILKKISGETVEPMIKINLRLSRGVRLRALRERVLVGLMLALTARHRPKPTAGGRRRKRFPSGDMKISRASRVQSPGVSPQSATPGAC